MGFLDDLRDKASGLIEDVKDRLDRDDETPAGQVEAGADHSPAAVDEASRGPDEAVAQSPAVAEASADETAADEVGDIGEAPAAAPFDPAVEAVDPVLEPVEPADLTEDPLDPALEAVDPVLEPTAPTALEEDPLEAPPDRTA